MKYFLDTEFLEQGPGKPIIPISIGIVAENPVWSLYMEYELSDDDMNAIADSKWLMENVVPHLRYGGNKFFTKSREEIADVLNDFFSEDKNVELWAYYGAYDMVVLGQTFGTFLDAPDNVPLVFHELKHLMNKHNLTSDDFKHLIRTEHDAFEDARWNREVFLKIQHDYYPNGINTRGEN